MDFPIEPYTCLGCGAVRTTVADAHGTTAAPRPGLPHCCSNCLFVSVFVSPTQLRPATRQDLSRFYSRECFVRTMLRLQLTRKAERRAR